MPLKTNEKNLVQNFVQGSPLPPMAYGWEVDREGKGMMLPSVGGITPNVLVGDSVYEHVGDHLEPAVSCIAGDFSSSRSKNPNLSFNIFSCIGNEAILISGDAKGKKGIVTGHHGGVEHVIIDFPVNVMKKMTYSDKIMISTVGQGLKLLDYPSVHCSGIDPKALKKIPIKTAKNAIEVPVVAKVPAKLMGSGMGHSDTFKGDYDIQTSDKDVIKKHKLENLSYGDLVAIIDHESTYGWSYKTGAVSIAVVVHGDSFLAGHGPGVQTILTSREGLIHPKLDKKANMGHYLKLGRYRKST